MDDPEDVRQDDDGVWHIRAGARVRVRLTMVADNRRYHVALSDPLPAGWSRQPRAGGLRQCPADPDSPDYRYGWWWWGPGTSTRTCAMSAPKPSPPCCGGVYQYTYLARATTPRRLVCRRPKPKRLLPEVFGRSAGAVVLWSRSSKPRIPTGAPVTGALCLWRRLPRSVGERVRDRSRQSDRKNWK